MRQPQTVPPPWFRPARLPCSVLGEVRQAVLSGGRSRHQQQGATAVNEWSTLCSSRTTTSSSRSAGRASA